MRKMTLDLPAGEDPPELDSLLATARRLYRVHTVAPVDSKIWPNRWKLLLDPMSWADGAGSEIMRTQSYRKGETPVDAFGPWPLDDEAPS